MLLWQKKRGKLEIFLSFALPGSFFFSFRETILAATGATSEQATFLRGKGTWEGQGASLFNGDFCEKEEKMEGLDRVFGRKVLILEKGRGGGVRDDEKARRLKRGEGRGKLFTSRYKVPRAIQLQSHFPVATLAAAAVKLFSSFPSRYVEPLLPSDFALLCNIPFFTAL